VGSKRPKPETENKKTTWHHSIGRHKFYNGELGNVFQSKCYQNDRNGEDLMGQPCRKRCRSDKYVQSFYVRKPGQTTLDLNVYGI
jgi:hypothetical protein